MIKTQFARVTRIPGYYYISVSSIQTTFSAKDFLSKLYYFIYQSNRFFGSFRILQGGVWAETSRISPLVSSIFIQLCLSHIHQSLKQRRHEYNSVISSISTLTLKYLRVQTFHKMNAPICSFCSVCQRKGQLQ